MRLNIWMKSFPLFSRFTRTYTRYDVTWHRSNGLVGLEKKWRDHPLVRPWIKYPLRIYYIPRFYLYAKYVSLEDPQPMHAWYIQVQWYLLTLSMHVWVGMCFVNIYENGYWTSIVSFHHPTVDLLFSLKLNAHILTHARTQSDKCLIGALGVYESYSKLNQNGSHIVFWMLIKRNA